MREKLAIGASAPPELAALEAKVAADAPDSDIGIAMYELLVAMTLNFDTDGQEMVPKDAPEILERTNEVAEKMTYLYRYGMRMVSQDVFDVDSLKDMIIRLLANRVGLTGEELDQWLDV